MGKYCFCGNLVKNDAKFSRDEMRFCSLECQIAAGEKNYQYYLARKKAVEKESAAIEEARKRRVVAIEEERRERSKAFEEERRKLTSVWQIQMNDALGNAMEWWFTLSDSQRLARVHEAANHLGPSQSVWCRAMAGCRRKELYVDWSNEMREWYLLSEPQKLETLKQVVVDEEAWLLKIRELQQARIAESLELIAKKNAFVQEQRKAEQEAVNLERLEQSQAWAVTWNNLSPGDQDRYRKNERELEELEKKIAKVAFSEALCHSLHEQINEIKQKQLIFQRDKKFIDEQAAQREREAEEIKRRSREFGDLHKPQNTKKVTSVEKAMSLLKKLTADMARVQKALKELSEK